MKINENINLVLDLYEGGPRLFHTPISRDVFEANFRVLAATKAALFGKGAAFAAGTGPAIARLTLLDEGRNLAQERGEEGDSGAMSLLYEIKRLTTVLVAGANGYEAVPIDSAISSKTLDEDDWREKESLLVFFTSAYALAPSRNKKQVAESLCAILECSLTSLNCAAYASGSKTVTKAAASSVPV